LAEATIGLLIPHLLATTRVAVYFQSDWNIVDQSS